MDAEDRVLVGVVNRKKDFSLIQQERWYRIPQERMPNGVFAEVMAFFLSGRVFKEQSGGIHYYAPVTGLELVYRRDLIPDEPNHKNANKAYYRVALGELLPKEPPVLNPTRRPISFVFTTWDRFVYARTIPDLYSQADYFVDRIYHALRNRGVRLERGWEAQGSTLAYAPGLSILCENGATLNASTVEGRGAIYMDMAQSEDAVLRRILDAIEKCDGPSTINNPMEG
ncbi:MAG: hypothetical protein OHK0046_43310 [Anaerolineae bacterium]